MLVRTEAYHDGESWSARGIGEEIFSQGETLEDLIPNVKEAVVVHFGGVKRLPDVLTPSEVKLRDAATTAR
jgi:hypothetical protein